MAANNRYKNHRKNPWDKGMPTAWALGFSLLSTVILLVSIYISYLAYTWLFSVWWKFLSVSAIIFSVYFAFFKLRERKRWKDYRNG